ncbi:MAG: hypothetical protein RR382_04280, partial [Tannerellaceae bacterium]
YERDLYNASRENLNPGNRPKFPPSLFPLTPYRPESPFSSTNCIQTKQQRSKQLLSHETSP